MLTDTQRTVLARTFRVLSDESRLNVLQAVAEARKPVNQEYLLKTLADHNFSISQQNLSYCLNQLAQANIIDSHRAGRNRWYTLNVSGVSNALLFIANLQPDEVSATCPNPNP